MHWRCNDIKASLNFYTQIMGARLLKHYTTSYNLEIYLLELGNITIALSPAHNCAPCANGMYQLALQVNDIQAAVAELESKGLKCKSGILQPTPGVKAAMFDDPDGVEIELMQC